MRQVHLPGGEAVPALGLGTWRMGEARGSEAAEVKAIARGVELGMNLIDTAEMYGGGEAERRIAKAIAGKRDKLFIVSKVLPENATRAGTVAACERSLKRLGTDRIDLYLLHWPGSVPLAETLAGFETLLRAQKIRYWGVSNFDMRDLDDLAAAGGTGCAANQVLYNLSRRGIEWDVVPRCRAADMMVMAYSPLEQGRMLGNSALKKVASARGLSAAQVALAWALAQGASVIPKATDLAHVEENAKAADLALSPEEMATLDRAFPPPKSARPLDML
ncbi:MAG TPA: aldo/keto reductase [Stellaceae bacterium]|nr:aldo/keto reductase [Stellaceae bacterium]